MLFFFFQAEDGIRDIGVTGVQTCALPIYVVDLGPRAGSAGGEIGFEGTVEGLCGSGTLAGRHLGDRTALKGSVRTSSRSEERRVGKEGRSRWAPYHLKKKICKDIL